MASPPTEIVEEERAPTTVGPGSHFRLGDREDQRAGACSSLQLAMVARHGCWVQPDHAALRRHHVALDQGGRHLGRRRSRHVGVRDRQFRLVDRNRACGNADLGDLAALETRLAHVNQPVRRGDDPVRGRLCGPFSALTPGTSLGLLLVAPVPQHDGSVAAMAQSPGVGRLRGFDLRHGFAALLVRRLIPDMATLRDRAKTGSPASSTE